MIVNFWTEYWTKIELTLGYQVFKSQTVVSTLSQLEKTNKNNVHHYFCLTKNIFSLKVGGQQFSFYEDGHKLENTF